MSLESESVWEVKVLDDLSGGVNVSARTESLKDDQSPRAVNLTISDSELVSDTGYKTFLGVVRGAPRAEYQVIKMNGTNQLILITDSTFYRKVGSQWQYPSGGSGVATTLSSTALTGATSLTVGSIAGFANGDDIGIELDDGTQHQTTISGAPSGVTINIASALPSGATSGNYVCKAPELNGVSTYQVQVVSIPGSDWIVFTNGVDNVKRYDGTSVEDVPNLPSSGDTVCRSVGVYNTYLLLINTTEGGVNRFSRVRWSAIADPTTWPVNNYIDLVDTDDYAVAGYPLSSYFIIYKQKSIIRMSFIGSSAKTFNFDYAVQNEGVNSVYSVVPSDQEHLIFGQSNIYIYRGDMSLEPIADNIWSVLFGNRAILNPLHRNKIIGMFVNDLDEVWFNIPLIGSTYPNMTIRYMIKNQSWWYRLFATKISGFGFYSISTSKRWIDLNGKWSDQTWKWNSSAVASGNPTIHLLDPDNLRVYEYDYISGSDNGTSIEFDYQTKEFFNPDNYMRFDSYKFEARGTSVILEYSTDRGNSWTQLANQNLLATYELYDVGEQFIANRVRFRFRGTGSNFGLRWFAFRWRPESIH